MHTTNTTREMHACMHACMVFDVCMYAWIRTYTQSKQHERQRTTQAGKASSALSIAAISCGNHKPQALISFLHPTPYTLHATPYTLNLVRRTHASKTLISEWQCMCICVEVYALKRMYLYSRSLSACLPPSLPLSLSLSLSLSLCLSPSLPPSLPLSLPFSLSLSLPPSQSLSPLWQQAHRIGA